MKKKYKIAPTVSGGWFVIEEATAQIVASGTEPQMRQVLSKLNGGCGFKGNTPAFLLHDFL